jgi:heavy metal sensor kinase
MLDTVRSRLTLWYVSVLAAVLVAVTLLIYLLLARAIYARIDGDLARVVAIALTSLANDLAEGQDTDDAARSTAAELSSRGQMLAIYTTDGRLLAEQERPRDLRLVLPELDTIPDGDPLVYTVVEERDDDDRHRLAVRRTRLDAGAEYIVLVGTSLEPTDEELESLREILLYVLPGALVVAGIGGSFLARHSLAPVVAMADRARRIGVGNLEDRLPVANARDELGRLAETFNELLGRLAASFSRQRQFMADASHELRTPVTTVRTAAAVTLQQPHRSEREYRDALEIVEQESVRLSRIVDDMFTLARADAGTYPVRSGPLYLDEVLEDVVRGARVIAATRHVSIEQTGDRGAAFTGDEDLIVRMAGNLVDNAVRHTPPQSVVRVHLSRSPAAYVVEISDAGPGIPVAHQPHIFERFYRGDESRARSADAGAGLGLALARWIARVHGGDVALARSSEAGTTFTITLPASGIPGA